jgi:hypothetical protein
MTGIKPTARFRTRAARGAMVLVIASLAVSYLHGHNAHGTR